MYVYVLTYVYWLWGVKPGKKKDHFPLSFLDQVLKSVMGHEIYFLDGYSNYYPIEIALEN